MKALTALFLLIAAASAAPAASATHCTPGDVDCTLSCTLDTLLPLVPVHDCVLGTGDVVSYGYCPPGTTGSIYVYDQQVTTCFH